MVLICKQARGDHYTYKHSLKVQDYKVEDVTSRTLSRITRDARWAYSFMLVHKVDRLSSTDLTICSISESA